VTTLGIEEAKLFDSIRLEVRDAVNAVREAGEIIRALSGTVARAERLLLMAEKGFEYGVKTKLEVDDAQSSLVQAKGNLAMAQRGYLVARVTYRWALGIIDQGETK
jgi:HAE1 family hydrophobic/amphiphilic exporter-1